MVKSNPAQRQQRSHPRVLGVPLPWALAMFVPMMVSVQLTGVSVAMAVYAEDLAWEFVTEKWVWFRLGLRLLDDAQVCFLVGVAVWAAWCLVTLAQWIIGRVRR